MSNWRVIGCRRETIRLWDDDCVAFNSLSGATHILSAVAGEVLFILFEHSADTSELRVGLATKFAVPDDADLGAAVDRALAEMDELGLIQREES